MIRTAWGPIFWYMKWRGFYGLTFIWHVIYIMPGYEQDKGLIRHELKHIDQMKRDGHIVFMFKYIWYNIKYGYHQNPYEVEARLAQYDYRSDGA